MYFKLALPGDQALLEEALVDLPVLNSQMAIVDMSLGEAPGLPCTWTFQKYMASYLCTLQKNYSLFDMAIHMS